MKKRFIFFFLVTIIVGSITGQAIDKQSSSYDSFISQSGVIIKLQDYILAAIPGSAYISYDNKVRVIASGEVKRYYLQITKTNKNDKVTGSIESLDLISMNNAIKILQKEYDAEKDSTVDYTENKYITNDGMQVGYYISFRDSGWFIKLDKYKTDSLIFFNDSKEILDGIQSAIDKINELKNK